jgi:hypothetical protein
MSAYIVDPRTVDYLVAWCKRHKHDHGMGPSVLLTPEEHDEWYAVGNGHLLHGSRDYPRIYLAQVPETILGQAMMTQNVRSVRARYPEDSADDLPGPCDQSGVFSYRFRPIGQDLRPAWVYKAAACWQYQSCETTYHASTLAWRMVEAIREDAADAMAEADNPPWGVTDEDLIGKRKKIA